MMKFVFFLFSLSFSIFHIKTEKNCFFESAEGSLRACMTYLNELSASGFGECKNNQYCTPDSKDECPSSCAEVQLQGQTQNGVYKICAKPWFNLPSFDVFCDLQKDGGGWTVFQRRGNFGEPPDTFFRNWTSYKDGFGNFKSQFWLGNDKIFALTNEDRVTLRIELRNFNDEIGWAEYNDFRIESEKHSYKLSHLGNYSGNAGDSLSIHKGQEFYTSDHENPKMRCLHDRKGGWWYTNCHQANLNGFYVEKESTYNKFSKSSSAKLMSWASFSGYESLKFTEMKIRPAYFKSNKHK